MKEENGSYLWGIIGGFLGGFIATIPWTLVYVYGNMILSLLAIIIALGVLKGYQFLHGKVDEKLPIIIVIISCICMTISTFIITPILLLNKENIAININSFKWLYNSSIFLSALIKDYIISLLFTFLGISGVVSNIRRQINEGGTNYIKIPIMNNNIDETIKEEMEHLKQVFLDLNATDKYSAVPKEEILVSFTNKSIFNRVRRMGIIKKYKGNYYYSLKDEQSPFKRFIKLYLKIMGIIILFCLLLIIIFM